MRNRYTPDSRKPGGIGSSVLVMKRSRKSPNTISQTISGLEPGRSYSLKLLVADFDEFTSGRSDPLRNHTFSIDLTGVTVAVEGPGGAITERYSTSEAGHAFGPFNRTNGLLVTYARRVFTSQSPTGSLTISDWANRQAPGGPEGQRLMFNFVEVAPFLSPRQGRHDGAKTDDTLAARSMISLAVLVSTAAARDSTSGFDFGSCASSDSDLNWRVEAPSGIGRIRDVASGRCITSRQCRGASQEPWAEVLLDLCGSSEAGDSCEGRNQLWSGQPVPNQER